MSSTTAPADTITITFPAAMAERLRAEVRLMIASWGGDLRIVMGQEREQPGRTRRYLHDIAVYGAVLEQLGYADERGRRRGAANDHGTAGGDQVHHGGRHRGHPRV